MNDIELLKITVGSLRDRVRALEDRVQDLEDKLFNVVALPRPEERVIG